MEHFEELVENKLLIVLPCNSGAYIGNYWSRPSWQFVGKRLKDMRELVEYSAVDSIRCFHVDGRGLVHEKENHIVKGYDESPLWSKFSFKQHGTKKLDRLKDSIKLSLKEMKDYRWIFALLSPRAYKLSFSRAIKESGLEEKTTILDIGETPAYYNKGVIELEKFIRDYVQGRHVRKGLFMPSGHEKYFNSKFGNYRNDGNFPQDYRIWNMF